MKNAWLFALMLLASLTACSSVDVSTDYDRDTDFSGYRTWAWLPKSEMKAPDAMAQNPLAEKRIRASIEQKLVARGFPKATDGPDFLVTFLTGVKDRLNVTHWGYGYGGRWGPGGGYSVSNYREGTLFLDIIDPQKRQLVWRGTTQAVVRDQESTMEEVHAALDRMLDDFPPAR